MINFENGNCIMATITTLHAAGSTPIFFCCAYADTGKITHAVMRTEHYPAAGEGVDQQKQYDEYLFHALKLKKEIQLREVLQKF